LLTLSEEHDITLHGQANRRDLSDADDRFFLRIEVAHACRSSDDTSRRLRDALEDRAQEGRAHTSARRPYGYTQGGTAIIEGEARVVREVFARYLEGDTPPQIARNLNERGVPTSQGCRWRAEAVRALISSRHVSGIRVLRGEDFGDGDWPMIIDRGTWTEAQDRRVPGLGVSAALVPVLCAARAGDVQEMRQADGRIRQQERPLLHVHPPGRPRRVPVHPSDQRPHAGSLRR
jgi:site-specific DNA recombinase